MNERKRSIKELKTNIKNKTLGCYNKQVVKNSSCLYFHGDTGTCCAIGAIIPSDVLFKRIDSSCDVSKVFTGTGHDSIGSQLDGKDGLYGLNMFELKEIQGYHDDAVSKGFNSDGYKRSILKLENFIADLK